MNQNLSKTTKNDQQLNILISHKHPFLQNPTLSPKCKQKYLPHNLVNPSDIDGLSIYNSKNDGGKPI